MLDAAERLLRKSATAEFSMRELASEAGVGFATPFNHFGSKIAIMQALSSRLIERMARRFREDVPRGDAIDRVLAMGRIAVAALLEQPDVNKAVVGSLGLAGPAPSSVRPQSEAIWSLALGDFTGIDGETRARAEAILPQQLAFLFRGCVSFWIAGELSDDQLPRAFEAGASTLLLAFADDKRRAHLLKRIIRLPATVQTSPTGPRSNPTVSPVKGGAKSREQQKASGRPPPRIR
ncbi:TetR/AcrR family transcriptional regulator [Bradyrhizobium sp. STM 3557]|uniref:TetR/AcrR family transcriptional regulator n=1 Tax=Bradyrhizobium sp. STM 3557 TaxID=578920 RepID=UPI00388DA224